jgi:hypothetical protein
MVVNRYINSDKNPEITQHPYTMLYIELNKHILVVRRPSSKGENRREDKKH